MADARRMGKSELFSHFAERFEVKRTQAREFFDELTTLAEKELKRSGEFVLPGMVKLVKQHRKARMGRNPGHRRSDQDPGEDRREGQDRQAAERRGPAAQVAGIAPQRGCRVGGPRPAVGSITRAAAREHPAVKRRRHQPRHAPFQIAQRAAIDNDAIAGPEHQLGAVPLRPARVVASK